MSPSIILVIKPIAGSDGWSMAHTGEQVDNA